MKLLNNNGIMSYRTWTGGDASIHFQFTCTTTGLQTVKVHPRHVSLPDTFANDMRPLRRIGPPF